jgi:AcrR family transcriptional regulator
VTANTHPDENSGTAPAPGARERLIEAAMTVFAREGLHKATTRAIAEEAAVSEVTLFRHFKNKDGLLAAVIGQAIRTHAEEGLDDAHWKGNFKKGLLHFGMSLYSNLVRDEDFIRTMVGEAKRHPDHAEKVICDVVKPMRDNFIAKLEAARKDGKIRKGIDLVLAADTFTAMLFGGMLKNTGGGGPCAGDYTPEKFVGMCVDIFAAGIAPVPRS